MAAAGCRLATSSHNGFSAGCVSTSQPSDASRICCRPVLRASRLQATALNASVPRQTRPCECYDMFQELVPYVEAWRWQKAMVENLSAATTRGEDPTNVLLLLQHPPVYTMGTRSSDEFLRFDKAHPPFELHRTERGGEVTYHGPGQLVMYPILNLRHYRMDLHWYLRMLEEVVIRALRSSCGLMASRVDGLTGVWVGSFKVAAIGVRVSRWITYHGLALNVYTDLAPFGNIIPCGITNRPVGSLLQLLQPDTCVHGSGRALCEPDLASGIGKEDEMRSQMWDEGTLLNRVHNCLLAEFAEIFGLEFTMPTTDGPKTYA